MGSVVAVLGTTVGACVAFLLVRTVARCWIGDRMVLSGRLAALDQAVGEQGLKIVVLSRLSPIALFLSLNYAFGLTRVSLGQYGCGTLIGGAPGTILYAFFGAGLHSLHEVITYSQRGTRTWVAHQVFFGASLIVAVGVSAWLTYVTRRALREAMPRNAEKQEDTRSLQETDSSSRNRFT